MAIPTLQTLQTRGRSFLILEFWDFAFPGASCRSKAGGGRIGSLISLSLFNALQCSEPCDSLLILQRRQFAEMGVMLCSMLRRTAAD